MKTIQTLLIAAAAALVCASCSPESNDNWDELSPYWGERPGTEATPLKIQHKEAHVYAHLFKGAATWVEEQKQRFDCKPETANDTDLALLTALGRKAESCTVWRSPHRYDLAHYQAAQPTFIIFENGDCLFYLYDLYSTTPDLCIPPDCQKLQPLSATTSS